MLRELKGVHDPERRTRLRDELKWAQTLTGPVRDLDVELLEWEELVGLLAPERQPQLEPLRELLARRRARELTKLRRGLRSERFRDLFAAWRALAEGPARGRPAERRAADRGGRRRADPQGLPPHGARRRPRSTTARPPEDLHDLRKRGKELRYLLELFGSPFPKGVVKPMVSTLKDLQEVLGRFQDRAVQIELLHEVRDELRERRPRR